MSNQLLSFISNEDLSTFKFEVQQPRNHCLIIIQVLHFILEHGFLCSVLLELQEKVKKKKANKDKEFTKNAIDPFTALFQIFSIDPY